MTTTFFWHDYETWGANPTRDRPSQFAGVRTDEQFNIIGEPVNWFCAPARDFLPQPMACLITGITPQQAREQGECEAEFIARVHAELAQPGTCGVGYNSLRFDDEVTRFTLYRNFYDPYAREWQQNNSRWDLIDVLRMCRALRPEGIEWPDHDDGTPSFRLEDLSRANNLLHEAAHDALSDVYATIAVAKLLKEKQPRLFAFALQLRRKQHAAELLDVVQNTPVLHSSAMFPAQRMGTALVMPLAPHSTNKNGVVAYDLSVDPTALIKLSADEIRTRLYTKTQDLPEGTERIALKTIHINRAPVLAPTSLLDDTVAQRIGLDLPRARQHYQQLKNASGLTAKLQAVFADTPQGEVSDPDISLYSGGFFSPKDRRTMDKIITLSPQQLATLEFNFDDERLPEMLFRYRARNFPDTLNAAETERWETFRFTRLTDSEAGGGLVLDDYLHDIEERLADATLTERDRTILHALQDYSDELLA